ncbi:hypothetical protein BU23DRAFT_627496 [Bimuria novae-zelandiae CBS 107.79]|uniref:Uncharacterized protein n=1 Tax=Bimuria novae-zelandiae CBS 107.79 TaxID=1447943 RepID=A0A6A5UJV2_9PLEO|nr:hypothetical protein BU23DRAFT_627496 [Bimuria novae-zelandiae CBS 107.79]
MRLPTLSLLASLLSTSSTTPLAPRGIANVFMYSGDSCSGRLDRFAITSGEFCVPAAETKRSIRVTGSDCKVKMWSSADCKGNAWMGTGKGMDGACVGPVAYGSVTVEC